jgi:hypothetical protein
MRLKLKCRGANKIPSERLFCLDKKLYKISITLEGLKLPEAGSKLGGDGDEGGDSHDKGKFDNVDDLDDPHDDQFADKN